MKLKDKVAIVVGGGSGIGRASATLMAQEGASVMIADLSMERANKVADNIKAMGGEAATIKIDMRKEEDAQEMVKATLGKYGKVDILVNVAGGSVGEFIIDRAEVGKFAVSTRINGPVSDVNLNGCRHCTRAVINHMIEGEPGKSLIFFYYFREGNAGVNYTAAKEDSRPYPSACL
jgi:NADP-dependent 3-hydroxy acid dehydrogenase YdfG